MSFEWERHWLRYSKMFSYHSSVNLQTIILGSLGLPPCLCPHRPALLGSNEQARRGRRTEDERGRAVIKEAGREGIKEGEMEGRPGTSDRLKDNITKERRKDRREAWVIAKKLLKGRL